MTPRRAIGALLLTSCATSGSSTGPFLPDDSGGKTQTAASVDAGSGAPSSELSFVLNGTTWLLDAPGASLEPTSSGSVRLVTVGGPTYWISRYEEGAGPIDLTNARRIILDEPDPPVLFERPRSGDVSYELVVRGPDGPHGERLTVAPDGTGATVLCSFRFPSAADEPAWRAALDVCRSLRPAGADSLELGRTTAPHGTSPRRGQ